MKALEYLVLLTVIAGGAFDATELRMQTPSCPFCQRATWSQYKHHNTVKCLVMCSPCGAVIYVSPGFPGRITDPRLVEYMDI